MKKKIIAVISGTAILIIAAGSIYGKFESSHKEGEPDVVGTFSVNRDENITVVANREDIEDRDEIFSKGNTIRNILEYTLKHFCVIRGIEMNIEQKYGHIDLGELRKKIKDIPNINIPQSLVNTANELSHDSGKKYNIENVREFYGDVCELIKQIKDTIWTEENDL